LLEAAESASGAGAALSEMTVLIGHDGAIRIIASSDWPLDRLREHAGARMAYRVSQRGGTVAVEGRSQESHCRLESRPGAARRILRDLPRYLLAGVTSAGWSAA
jgi:hypothetical protein